MPPLLASGTQRDEALTAPALEFPPPSESARRFYEGGDAATGTSTRAAEPGIGRRNVRSSIRDLDHTRRDRPRIVGRRLNGGHIIGLLRRR